MSTAEPGISLAEMIRQDKINAIFCTEANLEEDIFNLISHSHYKRVPHYRLLTLRISRRPADIHGRSLCISHGQGQTRAADRRKPERKKTVATPARINIFPNFMLLSSFKTGKNTGKFCS